MKRWNDTLILEEKENFCREGYYFHLMYLKIASLTIRGGGGGEKKVFKVGSVIYNISRKSFEVNFLTGWVKEEQRMLR